VLDDPYINSRDRFVQDLRLNKPYSSASTGNVNDNAFSGTATTGAYVVYLSDTGGTISPGATGENVVCNSRKTAVPASNPYVFYNCGTDLSGLNPNDGFTASYSNYELSNGSRAWFSLDASATPATHLSGFVCGYRQTFLGTVTANTSPGGIPLPPPPLYISTPSVSIWTTREQAPRRSPAITATGCRAESMKPIWPKVSSRGRRSSSIPTALSARMVHTRTASYVKPGWAPLPTIFTRIATSHRVPGRCRATGYRTASPTRKTVRNTTCGRKRNGRTWPTGSLTISTVHCFPLPRFLYCPLRFWYCSVRCW